MQLRFAFAVLVGAGLMVFAAAPPVRAKRGNDLRPVVLRPGVINTVTRSIRPMLIDLYWLRTLNAIGDPESREKNRALYDYGLTLTEVDPRFYTAYTYIGLNIPYQTGRLDWVNAELASDLFRRGLQQFPDDMKLHLYLGYSLFGQEKKYAEASAVFLAGSKKPGALSFMAPLAARLLSHSGKAEDALSLTRAMLASSTDEESRLDFEGKVAQLEVEVALQHVDRAIEAYREANGRAPADLEALVAGGFYRGPREDPTGGLISIGEDGRATSSSVERRYQVFE